MIYGLPSLANDPGGQQLIFLWMELFLKVVCFDNRLYSLIW
jgi:hypothetical protein